MRDIFKLGRFDELSHEQVRIQVSDKNGEQFPVIFTKTMGQYGPEISIFSENKDLEEHWTQYFRPAQDSELAIANESPLPQETKLFDQLSCKAGVSSHNSPVEISHPLSLSYFDSLQRDISDNSDFYLLSSFYIALGLLGGGRRQSVSHKTLMATLLPILLPTSVKADFWSNLVDFFTPKVKVQTPDLEKAIEQFGKEVRIIIDKTSQVIDGKLEKIDSIGKNFIGDFGTMGKVWISQIGDELRVSVDQLEKGAQATLQVAGIEARFIIAAAGEQVRITAEHIREQVQMVIKDAEKSTNRVLIGAIDRAGDQADRVILNFGKQGSLIIDKAQETFRVTADETLEKAVKGSEIVLGRVGSEARLTIKTFGEENRATLELAGQVVQATIEYGGKTLENIIGQIPIVGGNTAEEIARRFVYGLRCALWECPLVKEIEHKIDNFILSKEAQKQDKLSSVRGLLSYVYSQTQAGLSASEKASLYVKIMKHINDPGNNDEDRKCLLFFIAGVASQDENLIQNANYWVYSKKTNYFDTVVVPNIPLREVREAVQRQDLKPLIREGLDYMKKQSENFQRCFTTSFSEATQSETDSGVGVPIGTVIAFSSNLVPKDYIVCDGGWYPTDKYPELYKVLGNQYGKEEMRDRKMHFRVPDYRNLFLRGTAEESQVGALEEDMTRMPKLPFKTQSAGAHTHTTLPGGTGTYESSKAGGHTHTTEKKGGHTHPVSNDGKHKHNLSPTGDHSHHVQDGGKHAHDMTETPDHNHDNAPFKYLLHVNGYHTSEYTDSTPGEPNLITKGEIRPAGRHKHTIHSDGTHSHTLDKSGHHSHDMADSSLHAHSLGRVDDHSHPISSEPNHIHEISIKEHAHTITEVKGHIHDITGGDKETRPANRRVLYLIKAKPTVMATTEQIDALHKQIETLTEQLANPFTQPSVLLHTFLVGIAGILLMKFRTR